MTNNPPWKGSPRLRKRHLSHLYALPLFPSLALAREANAEFYRAWDLVKETLGRTNRVPQFYFELELLKHLPHPERIKDHIFLSNPDPAPSPVLKAPRLFYPNGAPLSPSKAKRVTDRQARKVLKLRSKTHPEDYKAGNRLFRGRRRLLRAAYLHHFTSDPQAHAKAREAFDHAWKTTGVAKVPGQAFFQGLFEHALIQSLPNGETLRRHLLPAR